MGKPRVAVEIVCKYLYKHDMYLSAPVTELNPQNEEPPTKQLRKEAMKDENYAIVLPSARTISDFKEMQASKIETNVAIALKKKEKCKNRFTF